MRRFGSDGDAGADGGMGEDSAAMGAGVLKQVGARLEPEPRAASDPRERVDQVLPAASLAAGLDRVVASLATRGKGVVMLMDKGGVGKTTLATELAVALARRGFPPCA